MKTPSTTRPPQADTSFAPLADLSLQAKRKAVRPGTAEFRVESSSVRNVLVQVLRGMLCLNVLSFGDFLDSGHPALRRFAASSAVRAAPAAQCTSKEKLPARPAAERKLCSGEQREVTRSPDASGKPQDAP
jgi:hypothetical protein